MNVEIHQFNFSYTLLNLKSRWPINILSNRLLQLLLDSKGLLLQRTLLEALLLGRYFATGLSRDLEGTSGANCQFV